MADPFAFIIQHSIPDPRDQQSFSGLNFSRDDIFSDEPPSNSGAIPIIIGEDNEQYYTPEQILPSISEELRNEEVPRDDQIGEDDEGISSRSVDLGLGLGLFVNSEFKDISVVDDCLNGVISVNSSVERPSSKNDNVESLILPQNLKIGDKNVTLMDVEEIDVMSKCNATTICKDVRVGSGGKRNLKTLENNHLCRGGGSYTRGDENSLHCGKELEGKAVVGEPSFQVEGGKRFDMGMFSPCRNAGKQAPSASTENVHKRFVTVDDLVNGFDKDDILAVAIKAGLKFPRPRWWGPEGYGKGRKDGAS
ncbi:hypothetical protein ACHQM5_004766 [Ranunculus cassubicifolius]